MRLSSPQYFVLHDMQNKASITWHAGRYAASVRALSRKGLIAFNGRTYEITAAGLAAISDDDPQKCGGRLRSMELGNPGDRVPCPICGKPVTLRRPFNGHITNWVQVPIHKRQL